MFLMKIFKFKQNDLRRKLSQSTDRTSQTVTVSVQSAFHWLSPRPWTFCTTGKLLHRIYCLLLKQHLSWYLTA